MKRTILCMFRLGVLAALPAMGVLSVSTSRADVFTFSAFLNGPSDGTPSPGTGFSEVDFDTVLNTMHVHVDFTGLLAPTTASHIHAATAVPGTGTAGVATTTPYFAGFPIGVTSGTYDNTLDMTLASSYNASYVTANGGTTASAEAALFGSIEAGTAYLNIHSTAYPGGEIRGFLTPAPEPGTWAIMALGTAFPVILRYRNKLRR